MLITSVLHRISKAYLKDKSDKKHTDRFVEEDEKRSQFVTSETRWYFWAYYMKTNPMHETYTPTTITAVATKLATTASFFSPLTYLSHFSEQSTTELWVLGSFFIWLVGYLSWGCYRNHEWVDKEIEK